jgi:streptomycin 6-kinase
VIADDSRARTETLIRKWGIAVEAIRETETSILAFGVRRRRAMVLKVARQGDELRSGEVLAAFRGNGVARVYELADGAVLLELAIPGTPLEGLVIDGRDEEATEVLADLIERMAGGSPPEDCPTAQDWGKAFDRYAASGDERIPRDLVESASRCYARLANSQRQVRLLHGDLHHGNVLSDSRRGWLAIDPKGVVGEIEFEIGAVLRNPVERPDQFVSEETIENRCGVLVRRLNLDRERLLRWAFSQAVLSAVWSVEDGSVVDMKSPALSVATSIGRILA